MSIAFESFQASCKLSDNGIDRDLADSDDEKGCPKTNRVLDELLPDPYTDENQKLIQPLEANERAENGMERLDSH